MVKRGSRKRVKKSVRKGIKKSVKKIAPAHHEVEKKCAHCDKVIEPTSSFCKHCGASGFPKKFSRKHHCPSCKGVIEEFSRFCKHCGSNVDTFLHSKTIRFLMYSVLFLVVVLTLLLFFAPTSFDGLGAVNGNGKTEIEIGKPFIKMSEEICSWQDGSFRACVNVNWKGGEGDYIGCDFSGSGSGGKSGGIYQSPFTCCENVGDDEGLKLVRSYLFDKKGDVYGEDTISVECDGRPFVPSPIKNVEKISYEKSFWFTAKKTFGHGDGEGTVFVNFPGNVQSCEINGRWKTNNQYTDSSGGNTGYCHRAEGIFYGNSDAYGQEVFSDPDEFIWAGYGYPEVNPVGKLHESYGIYLYTCDPQYYQKNRYYVDGVFSGFGTDVLRVDWSYFNEYPRPHVDVFVDLKCEIIK